MNQRHLSVFCGLLLVSITGFPVGAHPNVLFLAIDDLNDWTGALGGHPQAVSPNLDRLASEGVLFTNAHCDAPACNPSRAALMTGIRPSTSGVYHNSEPWRESPILAEAHTIPQWFRANGYSVRASGKIFHGRFPDPPSWDEYWPSQQKNKPTDPKPDDLPVNGIPRTSHFDWGPHAEGREEMGDWQVAEWVAARLGEASDRPFFLACGFFRPHLPWFAPQEYFDQFPLDEIRLPETLGGDLDDIPAAGIAMAKPEGDHAKVVRHDQWKLAVQGYLASIRFVDDCVGHVMDALDRGPHADDTIVVLWSDHGWHLGEKEHWRKFALWEEATRVQMIWRVPGVTSAGTRCEEPVNLLDIYPTLLDLAGLPANPAVEGLSLRPQLLDTAAPRARPALTTHGFGNHAIRDRHWRYIRYDDGSEELYDHRNDPREHVNLAGDASSDDEKERLSACLPENNADPVLSRARKTRKNR